MAKRTIQVEEKLPILQTLPLSLQHLFAMVGATILVPILVGLNPTVALFTGGVGTLLYILITKKKLPAYLGSSFAFINPIITISASLGGREYALSGCIASGVVYLIVALLVYKFGTNWIDKALPPVVVGPVVMIIGLSLARVAAVKSAGLFSEVVKDGQILELAVNVIKSPVCWVSLFTLFVAVIGSVYFKGFFNVIPVLIGLISGYIFSYILDLIGLNTHLLDSFYPNGKYTPFINYDVIKNANWIGLPGFVFPKFTWTAILSIAPIAIVTITEHIGHLLVTNNVVGRDFTKDPGLHRSLTGDGVATIVAGFLGGPPTTTYGENIGVMAISKVYSVWVIGWAAIIAISLSFVQKLGALIQVIPSPVIGGISILLFGVIASSGLRMLIEHKVDLSETRNLVITSVILIIGVGGTRLQIFNIEFEGMALATFIGIILNFLLPEKKAAQSNIKEQYAN
ncbi:uracil permease [Caldicellulosiruptoraceae bacterium PP1]